MPTATRKPDPAVTGLPLTPFARFIRAALDRHGYTNYSEFARRARISDQYLRYLLAGYNLQSRQPLEPSCRVLRRLADALVMNPPIGPLQAELEYDGMMRALDLVPHLDEERQAALDQARRATIEAAAAEARRLEREQLVREMQALGRRVEALLLGDETSAAEAQARDPDLPLWVDPGEPVGQ